MEVGGAAPAVTGTLYVTQDRMGSTRLVTGVGASVVACHDYLPFGEEIPGTVSGWGRNGTSCYTASGDTDVKFAGQLYDAETGLAYFNARYLRASMGSFISADEPLNDQEAGDPQSWKLDSYVRNNPLAYSDPTGMWTTCPDWGCWLNSQWYLEHFQYYLERGALNMFQPLMQTTVPVVLYVSAPKNPGCMMAAAGLGTAAAAPLAVEAGVASGPAFEVVSPAGLSAARLPRIPLPGSSGPRHAGCRCGDGSVARPCALRERSVR